MDRKREKGYFFQRLLQRDAKGDHPHGTQLSQVSAKSHLPLGVEVADDERMHSREDILNEIDDKYFEQDFDAVEYELSRIDVHTTEISETLSEVADKRSIALDAVSDTLSMNILRDYNKFNDALTCISKVQEAVEASLIHAKISREQLAKASLEVSHGVAVWKNAQKKKNIASTLAILKKLQSAIRVLDEVREDQDHERYKRSIESCSMCGDLLASESIPPGIIAIGIISSVANAFLCDIAEQMYRSLFSMTGNFDSDRYASLMEGYVQLTDASKIIGGGDLSPIQDIIESFTTSPYEKVKKVILGIAYGVGGLSNADESSLVDLLSHIQPDTFKMCFQQVLKVEYDILDSFIQLERWHSDEKHMESFRNSAHAMGIMDSIHVALPRARKLVWNEVSGSLMTVLQSVKLGHGENFVVVSKWIHAFLRIGEDFSGEHPEVLHSILSQQSIRFFKSYHHMNCIEALYTVLEKETYGVVDIKLPWFDSECIDSLPSGYESLEDCKAAMANLFQTQNNSNSVEQLSEVKRIFRQHKVIIGDGSQVSTTNSFWRLIKWIMEYLSLMRDLPSAVPSIALGLMELVDLFLCHVYATFIGRAPTSVQPWYESQALADYIEYAKLKSLAKYSGSFQGWYPESPLVSLLQPEKLTKSTTKFSSTSGKVSNSGNLYGFVERTVTSTTLEDLGKFLDQVVRMIEEGSFTASPISPEVTRLAEHLSTSASLSGDLSHALYGRCCSLLLPISWVPEAVSQGKYLASDPPSAPASWTDKLRRQLELLSAQLDSVKDAHVEGTLELWSFVFPAVSHAVVDGLSRVKKCTLEGRAAMSLDLQALAKTMMKTCPVAMSKSNPEIQDSVYQPREAAIRHIDDYIKGFYVPLEELHVWAQAHTSYTNAQVMALARCIQESMKKDGASLTELEKKLQNRQIDR